MKHTTRRRFLRQAFIASATGALGTIHEPLAFAAEIRNEGNVIDPQVIEQARQIHQSALTIDSHVDIFGPHYATDQLDPGIDNPKLRCDLVKMAKGGIDAVFLAAYTGQGPRDSDGYHKIHQRALAVLEAILRVPQLYPDRCKLALEADDVERIVQSGRRAIMIGMENGYPIGTDLANVEKFYRLGVRYITLSHNGHNQICDSCKPRPELGDADAEHNGLSPFGRDVVAEMNRLGIMVDVSHIAPKSFRDVLAVSRVPVIASHSGCKAVCDHPRNLDDDELRALADAGGVIQVVALGAFLRGKPSEDAPDATIDDFIKHLEHAVKIAGIDHVGIGTDFDGGGGITGFDNHADSLNVTVALMQRGFSEQEIKKIWGGNLLRVWRRVERK